MPFAPKIRKDMLQALEGSILPVLQSRQVPLLLMGPPFDFSGIPRQTLRKEPLPDNDKGPLQVIRQWPEYNLVASRGFNISFLYEGAMHRRVGILKSHAEIMHAKGLTPPPGIQIIKLTAPSACTSTNFTAREDGSVCPESVNDYSRTLSVCFDEGQAYTFHSSRAGQKRTSSHHLQLNDQTILHLGDAYLEALRINYRQYAQTLLFSIMLRLRYLLLHTRVPVGNSCWVDSVTELKAPLSATQIKHQILCEDIVDYIQNNLHRSLTLKSIAAHFMFSESHINNLFHKIYGITLMRYVTQLRIDVAKRILASNKERIGDIAQLTGFASTTSFSHVFRRQVGMSPREFRIQQQKKL